MSDTQAGTSGADLSIKALPNNPFAVVVDSGVGDSARHTAAIMALAYELRTQNLMEARRMGAYGVSEQEVAERIGGRTEADLRGIRDGVK